MDHVKEVLHWPAATAILAALAGWLPPIAALLGALWYLVLFHDRIKYGPKGKGGEE